MRKEIDEIDKKIVELLKERFRIVEEISEIKKTAGIGIDDKSRNREVVRNFKTAARGLDDKFVEELAELILSQSKRVQRR